MRPLSLSLALAAGLSLPALAARPVEDIQAELDTHNHMPREILVQYRPGADSWVRGEARSQVAAERLETVLAGSKRQDGKGDLELVRVSPGPALAAAIARLEQDPAVEFAEANWIYFHQATSNDPYVTTSTTSNQLWGMYSPTATGGGKANQFGSGATTAWQNNKTDCSSVYVGIIDEGYMYTHSEFGSGTAASNVGTNPGELNKTPGVDDDGNGYIDDIHGWDFDGNDSSVFDGAGDDHGTHVAGTIGAIGGNGAGVAGVCWSVQLMNAKFLGNQGGTTANAIKAVDYFTDLKTRHGLNLVATSNSWGGGGFTQGLQDAIERANTAGILFIAAAGNSTLNCETSSCYPAEYPNANVIAVASITSNGAISGFSNYGSTTIDIGAPGSAVWSTVPAKSGRGKTATVVSGYASYSGTSMATPHVSGAVALYAAVKGLAPKTAADAAAIKNAVLGAATATPALSGKTVTGGRLDVSGF